MLSVLEMDAKHEADYRDEETGYNIRDIYQLFFNIYFLFNISILLYLNIPMMHWLQKVWLRFSFEGGLKVKKLSNTSVGNLFILWD